MVYLIILLKFYFFFKINEGFNEKEYSIILNIIQVKQISGIYMRVTVGDVPVHPVLVSMSAYGAPVGPE